MNVNMIANKNVFPIVFVFYVVKLSMKITISSHLVTEVSATLFKYLLFSKKYVLGFQLNSFSHLCKFLYSHWHVLLFYFLFWITCCTIQFAFTITWNMFCHCFSFIFVCYQIKGFNIYVYCFFGTQIFWNKTLQLPVHLFKLIMKG